MITLTARFKALPGRETEAEQAIKDIVAQVEAKETGVIAYVAHAIPGAAGEFLFYEAYADESVKEAHMTTPHLKALLDKIGPVFDADYGLKIEYLDRLAGSVRG
jgi:quinol monooxygenase YgiN